MVSFLLLQLFYQSSLGNLSQVQFIRHQSQARHGTFGAIINVVFLIYFQTEQSVIICHHRLSARVCALNSVNRVEGKWRKVKVQGLQPLCEAKVPQGVVKSDFKSRGS